MQPDLGCEQRAATLQPGDDIAAPEDRDRAADVGRQREGGVIVGGERLRPRGELDPSRRSAAASRPLHVAMPCLMIALEAEADQPPDRLAIDGDDAILADLHRQQSAPRAPRSRISTAVRRSTKRWVSRWCSASDNFSSMFAGALGPFAGLVEPVGAVGDIGPGADTRDPIRQGLDIALHTIEPGKLVGEPGHGQMAVAFAQMAEDARNEARVRLGPGLAEIGQARGSPEAGDHRRPLRPFAHPGLVGEALEHREIDCLGRGAQHRRLGRRSRSVMSAATLARSGWPSRQ
jgi:hypothetical protein